MNDSNVLIEAAKTVSKYQLALGNRLIEIKSAIERVRSATDARAERQARNELWYHRKKATDYARAHQLELPTWADSRSTANHDRPEDKKP